ncbi:MAG: universal stress protein [Candidatus Thermoplasmatota archaeon]|nr:universal stress protein [Candidatus Thermoplasmatota archaeon]
MYERVILPTDGSELSFIGVEEGLEAAQTYDIPALAVYVIPLSALSGHAGRYRVEEFGEEIVDIRSDKLKEKGEEVLKEVESRADRLGVEIETTIEEGEPYERITELATKDDIIYISSHGRSGISKIFIGSTTSRVLKNTEATVAVVRGHPDV